MITLDFKTFQQGREPGTLTGVIYIELGSGAFPEKGWSDFPVILLGWWTEALMSLELPARRKVRWQFMDGPYSVTLTKLVGDVPADAMTFGCVANGLFKAAQRVIDYCEQQEMFSDELEVLRENVRRYETNHSTLGMDRGSAIFIELRPSSATVSRR